MDVDRKDNDEETPETEQTRVSSRKIINEPKNSTPINYAIEGTDGGTGNGPQTTSTNEKTPSPNAGRNFHVVLMVLSIAFALALQYWLAGRMDGLWMWTVGCETGNAAADEICRGNAMVLRVSCALTIYFLINTCITKVDPSFYNEQMGSKAIIIVFLMVACIFIPNYVFNLNFFAWVARLCGFAYIVVQQLVLIDLAYHYNDKFYNGEPLLGVPGWVYLIVWSILGFGLAITGWVLMYIYWECGVAVAFITVTVVGSLILLVVQLAVESEQGTLFTTATVTCYATYLLYSALSAVPSTSCNPVATNDHNGLQAGLGLVVVSASIGYVTYSSSNTVKRWEQSKTNQNDRARTNDLITGGRGQVVAQEDVEGVAGHVNSDTQMPNELAGTYWKSNLMLCLMSMYVGMVLTGWASTKPEVEGTTVSQRQGEAAQYLQITGQWLAMLLYLWTIIAPKLFPDRDFS
mmetsp:Transcript_96915/g.221952  ORF Transcript_96915/g.221952 Transcript_96915/m.221952 type:complete len:462 (-) Transcript_96915:117-1502(-)